MPIDPTTLHGRTLGSLTVEELEACPEGAILAYADDPTGRKKGGAMRTATAWVDLAKVELDGAALKRAYWRDLVIHLPGKEPPDKVPDPKPPVYAIGRFVVVPRVDGVRVAICGAEVVTVTQGTGGRVGFTHGADGAYSVTELAPGVDLDALLHAIAKAEGR